MVSKKCMLFSLINERRCKAIQLQPPAITWTRYFKSRHLHLCMNGVGNQKKKNNYSPQAREYWWIFPSTLSRGIFTNIHEPEANNCFSIITLVIIEIPIKQRNVKILPQFAIVDIREFIPRCSHQRVTQCLFKLALWRKTTFSLTFIPGKKQIKKWFIVVCTLIHNGYASLIFPQTIFSYCFSMLSEFAKVFERKIWRVQAQAPQAHNAIYLTN